MSEEFLDKEDNALLEQALREIGVNLDEEDIDWWRFWSFDKLQLDGDFALRPLRAFVRAMELMEERRKTNANME